MMNRYTSKSFSMLETIACGRGRDIVQNKLGIPVSL